MEVELRHLRAFLAVAEERSFDRAAKRLHVVQPTLSGQIRRLEAELGTELFDRRSRPIGLTAAGAAFRDEAQITLHHAGRTLERTRRAAQGEVGQLSVGATAWAQFAIVAPVLRAFRGRAPDVRLELSSPAPTEQLDALRKERLDVAFTPFARWVVGSSAIEVEPLLEEPMVAVVASDHPLAERAEVSLEDLANERFVTLSYAMAPGLIDKQLTTFHDLGIPPVEVYEMPDPAAMFNLIAAGVGVGMHMASFAKMGGEWLTFLPIAGDPLSATLLLVRRSEDDREIVRIFCETAREVVRSLPPARALKEGAPKSEKGS